MRQTFRSRLRSKWLIVIQCSIAGVAAISLALYLRSRSSLTVSAPVVDGLYARDLSDYSILSLELSHGEFTAVQDGEDHIYDFGRYAVVGDRIYLETDIEHPTTPRVLYRRKVGGEVMLLDRAAERKYLATGQLADFYFLLPPNRQDFDEGYLQVASTFPDFMRALTKAERHDWDDLRRSHIDSEKRPGF